MLELIIAFVMSMGYHADSGTHFTMNAGYAQEIQRSTNYEQLGGDRAFYGYVTVADIDDIVVTDDDNPQN